jgi:protein ImuA
MIRRSNAALREVSQPDEEPRSLTAETRPRLPLAFGVSALDSHLADGGLARGALHEIADNGDNVVDGAAATLFAEGIVARAGGAVLWCVGKPDLFAPATGQAGLATSRLSYVEAGSHKELVSRAEAGLSSGAFGSVVIETAALTTTALRRLQRSAESTGALGIIIRRGPPGKATALLATQWRIASLQVTSTRSRWNVELVHATNGATANVVIEACDEQGRVAIPTLVSDGHAGSNIARRFAATQAARATPVRAPLSLVRGD